ncbi:MAG TPA: DUF2795 domain-containing protein [Burkholderiales bacterium]|nr:DUF2795 domain-containing protein [Burkholderiales bacterium]
MSKINPVQVQKFLKGMDYPANKQQIVRKAQDEGADDNVRQMLDRLPDQDYETPAEVSKAIGEIE